MAWREDLKELLKDNRSRIGVGSGEEYWNSVVDVIARFAMRHPKIEPEVKFCTHCRRPVN